MFCGILFYGYISHHDFTAIKLWIAVKFLESKRATPRQCLLPGTQFSESFFLLPLGKNQKLQFNKEDPFQHFISTTQWKLEFTQNSTTHCDNLRCNCGFFLGFSEFQLNRLRISLKESQTRLQAKNPHTRLELCTGRPFHPLGFIFIQEVIHYKTPLRTPHATRTLYWTPFSSIRVYFHPRNNTL